MSSLWFSKAFSLPFLHPSSISRRKRRAIFESSALRPLGRTIPSSVPTEHMPNPTLLHHPTLCGPRTLRKHPRKITVSTLPAPSPHSVQCQTQDLHIGTHSLLMEPCHAAPSFLLLRGLEHRPQLSQEQDCSVPQPKFIGNFYRTYVCRNGSNEGYSVLCSHYHGRWKNLTENSVPVLNQEGQSTSPCVSPTQSHSWCSCP